MVSMMKKNSLQVYSITTKNLMMLCALEYLQYWIIEIIFLKLNPIFTPFRATCRNNNLLKKDDSN